jgi:hypothetical protein
MIFDFVSIEGAVAFILSFVLYTVSMASRGKRSLTHTLCYNQLRLLRPTQESVACLVGLSTKKQGRQLTIPKTLEERLATLQLSSATITGGMVAVNAMRSKETARVWKHFESANSLVVACLTALLLRWILLWSKVLFNPCCDNMQCWQRWFHMEHAVTKPAIVLLSLVTWYSVSHLGKNTSKLPSGSPLRYAPSSYMTAWIFGLATALFISTNTFSLQFALNELAARLLLWRRWLGMRGDDEASLLGTVTTGTHVLLILGVAWVGFVLAEPMSSSVQLFVYQFWVTTTTTSAPRRPPQQPHQQQQQQEHFRLRKFLMLLTATLPTAILVSFYWTDTRSQRLFLSWCWTASLLYWIKPLLQTHLDRSLPLIQQVLESKRDVTSDEIFHPFQNRYNRLVDTGIKLSVLPSALVVLLSMTTLCHPATTTIYPLGFGGPISKNETNLYFENLTYNVTHAVVNETWTLLGINTCGTVLPAKSRKEKTQTVHIERGSDLLRHVPAVPRTLAGTLAQWQKSSPATQNGGIQDIILSLLQHPLVTCTAARPILDLLTLLLASWWLVTVSYALAFSQRIRKEVGSYSFGIEQGQKSQ